MPNYIALMDFKDAKTGRRIQKDKPYPPDGAKVGEDWIKYLAGSKNRCGKPVIAEVKPNKPEKACHEPEAIENPFAAPVVEAPAPVLPDLPVPEEKVERADTRPVPNDETMSPETYDAALFVLAKLAGLPTAPKGEEAIVEFLHSGDWQTSSIGPRRQFVKSLGEKDYKTMGADEINGRIRQVMTGAMPKG